MAVGFIAVLKKHILTDLRKTPTSGTLNTIQAAHSHVIRSSKE